MIQIPPTSNSINKNILLYCDYDKQPKAKKIIEKIVIENIPYNAKVKINYPALVDGWILKKLDSKINESFMKSSKVLFGCECYNLVVVLLFLL